MKTKITLFIMMAFVAIGYVSAQTVIEVKPNYYDATVTYEGATDTYSVNAWGDMLLINNGTGLTPETSKLNCVVMNFLLPAIPDGEQLVDASFSATAVTINAVNSNADLYGINYRASDQAIAEDYYSGPFTLGENAGNGSDWGIMDDFFEIEDKDKTVPVTKTTDAEANIQLRDFIQKQYDDGGVHKYTFLRLSLDNLASALWQRYAIASEANETYYPRLVLTFDIDTSVDKTNNNSISVLVNSSKQLVVRGKDLSGSTLSVYSIDGKEVMKESISSDNFTSLKSMAQGVYVMKISKNSCADFIQKIIVQ